MGRRKGMSDEINAVIEKLCEKLGTSAQFLIPELAKLKIVNSTVMVVIGLFMTVVGVYFLPEAWRYDHREDKDRFDDSMWVLAPGSVTLVGFVVLATGIYALAGWIVSPTASAVLEIVNMLK
jgi:hypothetical protein